MNLLISGASGYIGSNLVSKLVDAGIPPGIITRKLSGSKLLGSLDSYCFDITKQINIQLNKRYDIFIHLAAANDVDSKDPSVAINATTFGTRNCLEFCKKNGIKKFIYFSTFQVYGKVEGILSEETPCEPGNDYGITHLFAEDYVKMYQRTDGIEYLILRPTNIYGAPYGKEIDRWSLVPNCFCLEAVEKKEIVLLSSGKQKRDFIDLNDLTAVTIELCNRFDEFKNSVINVSSGSDFSILEIAELVKEVYEKRYKQACNITIKSANPLKINEYELKRHKMDCLNHRFKPKSAIIDEINSIFRLLTG